MSIDRILRLYRRKGWVCVPSALSGRAVADLRGAVDEIVASSACATAANEAFDLGTSHSREAPHVRKIKRPHLWHPVFNSVVETAPVLDLVAKLLGGGAECSSSSSRAPSARAPTCVRFQGDKVVIKARGGAGRAVVCHQDWAFYPHSNDSLCTVSVVLTDMRLSSGGLAFVPGSHRGPVYSHHCRHTGNFVGGIDDDRFDPAGAVWEAPECPAGSIIVHHARTVHASPPNASDADRPLLLLQYAAGDAWPLQQHPRGAWGIDLPDGHAVDEWALYERGLVRGAGTRSPRLADVPAPIPAPWPGRGRLGSLYRQLEAIESRHNGTLDVEAAHVRVVRPLDPAGADSGHQGAHGAPGARRGGGGGGGLFATVAAARSSGDPHMSLEWQRLLHFVGAGPYGSLAGCDGARRTLQGALTAALAAVVPDHRDEDEDEDDDDDVYDALRNCYWRDVVGSVDHKAAAGWAEARAQARADEVLALVRAALPVAPHGASAMLDIGCADGDITARIGAGLGMVPDNVHGCDSRASMHAGEQRAAEGFVFRRTEPAEALAWPAAPLPTGADSAAGSAGPPPRRLPYDDASLDLVTALMTLHHIRTHKQYLDEVFRVLRPGGLLVFREHDVASPATAAVLDIVHGMHYRVWPAADHPNRRPRGWLRRNYRAWYQSASAWHRSVTAAGLRRHPSSCSQVHHAMGVAGGGAAVVAAADAAAMGAATETQAADHVDLSSPQQVVSFANPKAVFFGVYVK